MEALLEMEHNKLHQDTVIQLCGVLHAVSSGAGSHRRRGAAGGKVTPRRPELGGEDCGTACACPPRKKVIVSGQLSVGISMEGSH